MDYCELCTTFIIKRRYHIMRVLRLFKFVLRETESFHVRLLFWLSAIELQEENRTDGVPVFI